MHREGQRRQETEGERGGPTVELADGLGACLVMQPVHILCDEQLDPPQLLQLRHGAVGGVGLPLLHEAPARH